MHLKFNETSEVNFKYPKYVDHKLTPMFSHLTPGKLLQIDPYGVFVVNKVIDTQEGDKHLREISAYSREYEFAGKRILLAEGVYNFWNPADVENTIMGQILQLAPNWKIGSVSPTLIGKYRSFTQTDEKALDFMLSTLQSTYGCVFDFDTYNQVINVIDAESDVATMPVYLSADNLIKNAQVSTSSDNIITKLYVAGAEGVDIMNVNPTGDHYIYNLDYAIASGDLPNALALKWRTWQNEIFSNQPGYTALVALLNSSVSKLTIESATLNDLNEKRLELDNTRASYLQQQMVTRDEDTYALFGTKLEEVALEYADLETRIQAQEEVVAAVTAERDGYSEQVVAINNRLKLSAYFTDEELRVLDPYFIEDSYVDETFAVFDVDVSNNIVFNSVPDAHITFGPIVDGDSVVQDFMWTDVPCTESHHMAALSGGIVTIAGTGYTVSASLVEGTWDYAADKVICSLRLGAGVINDEAFNSGTLTCTFNTTYDATSLLAGLQQHEDVITSADGSVSHTLYYYTGSLTIDGVAAVYFTRNVSDYQRYTVEQELYDCATAVLDEAASPIYEFEIDSGNLLFEEKFAPFRDAIQLGCGVYLNLGDHMVIKPTLLEMQLDFEAADNFKLIFSNCFRRSDDVASYKEMVTKTSSLSRTLQTNKYTFGENRNTTNWVKNLLEAGYDAALAQILAGDNQIVSIDKAGIKVDSADGQTKIYLNNGMIALYDKLTNTVRMGLGRFYNKATGTDFVGVLADIIGGTLLAGQNLIIECPDPNGGVMQFKVDSSGVIINGGRFYIHNDKGAFATDPNYGSMWGTSALFTPTDTGHIVPTCIDENGDMILDENGWPQNVNVWIGIDGKVYIRGNIYADNGVFNGEVNAFKGTFKEIDISDSEIKASSFSGGSININDTFIVDAHGRVTISSGTVDGYATTDAMNSAITASAAGITAEVNSVKTTLAEDYSTTEEMNSAINVSAESIKSEVSKEVTRLDGVDESLNSKIDQTATAISSEVTRATNAESALGTRITQTDNSIQSVASRVTANESSISTITQTTNSLTTEVSKKVGNDEIISRINQSAEGIKIEADKLDIDAADLNITVDSMLVKDTSGNTLFSAGDNAVSLSGWTVAANKLTNGTINTSGFIGLYSSFNSGDGDYNSSGAYLGAGNGAYSLQGNHLSNNWRLLIGQNFGVDKDGALYCSSGSFTGHIYASGGTIGAWYINSLGALTSSNTDAYGSVTNSVYLETGRLFYMYDQSAEYATWITWDNLINAAKNHYSTASNESDINVKNSISCFDAQYESLFDSLVPCKYKYNHGTSGRYHTGFIAQEVVEAVENAGLTTQDFAGVIHLEEPNENGCEWLLRRDEFVALNTWQIQKLKQRVADLEAKVEELAQLCASMNA